VDLGGVSDGDPRRIRRGTVSKSHLCLAFVASARPLKVLVVIVGFNDGMRRLRSSLVLCDFEYINVLICNNDLFFCCPNILTLLEEKVRVRDESDEAGEQ